MIESNHVVLWNRCLEVIKDNVPETTYNTWFAPIVPLKYEDKTLIVQIPSQFFYEILEERFVDQDFDSESNRESRSKQSFYSCYS